MLDNHKLTRIAAALRNKYQQHVSIDVTFDAFSTPNDETSIRLYIASTPRGTVHENFTAIGTFNARIKELLNAPV